MNTFVFTCGDVNGIGPEITIKTINKIYKNKKRKIIFVIPLNIFLNTTNIINPQFAYEVVKTKNELSRAKKNIVIFDSGTIKQNYGKPSAATGKAAYNSILLAMELTKANIADAIITAPISKEALKKAKINFPGHTELLADYFNVKKFAMMFVSKKMKAALATIHIPIKKVAREITEQRLTDIANVTMQSLRNDFDIKQPKVAILGLNPHAGENGNIGKEEKETIAKVIKRNSVNLFGPFVPDAFFGNKLYKNFDCTIGMYHDQVLIPFKLLNFNAGVNFTAGLPVVRTSPDHGTAFDIAGKGIANAGSMFQAFQLANKILNSRKKNFGNG